MGVVTVFRRYELKYLITLSQKEKILREMAPRMRMDRYGRATVRNIYYDTEDYRLIRRSVEKPVFKEKLRVRSYSQVSEGERVFVELKRKYEGVVYKRRLPLCECDAAAWLSGQRECPENSQIGREIAYFLKLYRPLLPRVFLSYQREAYHSDEGEDFRVTFDTDILVRQSELSLCAPVGGTPLLPADTVLMELKCGGGMPLWMARLLSRERIFKTSFSKYGTAYQTMIFPDIYSEKMRKNKETVTNGSII